jgi:uncharacterized membrane protein
MKSKIKNNVIVYNNNFIDFCNFITNTFFRRNFRKDSEEDVSQCFCMMLFAIFGVFTITFMIGIPIGYIHHNYIEIHNTTVVDSETNEQSINHYISSFYFLLASNVIIPLSFIITFVFILAMLYDLCLRVPYTQWKQDRNDRLKKLYDLEACNTSAND